MKASEITPKRVEFLFYPHLPLGKLSLLAGAPGQAKSLFTAWLAAANSNGQLDKSIGPSRTLMLSAEDDPADTIVPRLIAAGADLHLVEIEPAVEINIDRLGELSATGDVRLITIDPITAYLPGRVNAWKAQDVRAALEPLRQFAGDLQIAIVLIQHLNRRSDGDPLSRIADSQGIAQLCRSVMIWGPDPADPDGDQGTRKALTRAKANLARAAASATFGIVERDIGNGIKAPALVRGTDRQIHADEVISDHEARTALEDATEFLKTYLADGPQPSKDITTAARDAGIAERTLRRAKTKLSIRATQHRDENKVSQWTWELPDNHSYTNGHVGIVGHLGHVAPNLGGQDGQGGLHGHRTEPGDPTTAEQAFIDAVIVEFNATDITKQEPAA